MGHVDVSGAGNHGQCDYASLCYLHQGNLIGIAYRLMNKFDHAQMKLNADGGYTPFFNIR